MPGGPGKLRPEDNPKPFVKGMKRPAGAGSRKSIVSKLKDELKQIGYAPNEIKQAFQIVVSCSEAELDKVRDNGDYPLIIRIAADRLLNDFRGGQKSISADKILEHAIGKPDQSLDHSGELVEKKKKVIIIGGQEIEMDF